MDSELRRRFLQLLGFDLVAIDLRDAKVARPSLSRLAPARYEWPVNGPQRWPVVRAWWLPREGGR